MSTSEYVDSLISRWFTEEELNDKYWPYQFAFDHWKDLSKAEKFCYQNFKGRYWRSQGRYFGFKRKQDYEWFLLRWQ